MKFMASGPLEIIVNQLRANTPSFETYPCNSEIYHVEFILTSSMQKKKHSEYDEL